MNSTIVLEKIFITLTKENKETQFKFLVFAFNIEPRCCKTQLFMKLQTPFMYIKMKR